MTRPRSEPRLLVLALAVLVTAAHGQQNDGAPAAGGSGGAVSPRLGVSLGWTDNLKLAETGKDAALIATVSPGISIRSNSGSVRGTLDYTLYGIAYVKSSEGSQVQQSLSANGQAEIVPRTFYVDAQASIGQQSQSAFGLQSAPTLDTQGTVSTAVNANRSEVGTLMVRPLLRGTLGGLASVDLSGTYSMTAVRGSSLGANRAAAHSVRISQLSSGALAWFLSATTQEARAKKGPRNRSSVLSGGINYRPDPDWNFAVNAGHERSDYLGGGDLRGGFTGGVNATWTPTPRTRLNADWQRHVYGDSHGLAMEHRTVHAVMTLSDMRNVTLGNTGATGGLRTVYDLYFLLYASIEPDPIKRDARVRADLLAQGLSPDAPLATGFLSNGPSELRNQALSFAMQGIRTSLTVTATRAVTSRLGDNTNVGDLADHARIEQRSYSLTGAYRLSPVTSVSVIAARQQTVGDASKPKAQLTTLSLNWNGRLASRIGLQLGARHSRFEGLTAYTENAAYANLTQQF